LGWPLALPSDQANRAAAALGDFMLAVMMLMVSVMRCTHSEGSGRPVAVGREFD
jgi:hypothetical protein